MKIFIIPYRNREEQKEVFVHYMKKILQDFNDFEIIFVHQKDKKVFNRGAMKNIGFLYAKTKYPNIYKNITFIFHDIDYFPYKKNIIPYETTKGIISHFFGFKFALGGIFAIKGEDFEKMYGFPNYWGWGYEDNKFQTDWIKMNGIINYDHFHHIHHPSIIRITNNINLKRILNYKNVTYTEIESFDKSGFHTIKHLQYNIENQKNNVKMIHVTNFNTERDPEDQIFDNKIPPRSQRKRKIPFMSEISNSNKKINVTKPNNNIIQFKNSTFKSLNQKKNRNLFLL